MADTVLVASSRPGHDPYLMRRVGNAYVHDDQGCEAHQFGQPCQHGALAAKEAGETMTPDTALVIAPTQQAAVWQPPEPNALIASATAQANALADIIEKRKLFAVVNGRRHVVVEGWQTLGALNNLQAFTERVESGTDDQGNYWAAATVSARRMNDGAAIAQAEGFCSTKEARWRGRDQYAVRSMAQTRATSKVFRQAFAWVMVLAGYETTPAEEMPSESGQRRPTRTVRGRDSGPKPPEADGTIVTLREAAQNSLLNDDQRAELLRLGFTSLRDIPANIQDLPPDEALRALSGAA